MRYTKMVMSKTRSLPRSFKHAFNGFHTAVRKEPNFQIHVMAGCTALIAGYVLGLYKTEWIILLFTIAFVLILELFNTAIEAIVDLLSPKYHEKAKLAKDVSAAAVLVSSVLAVIIGTLLFVPKIILYFD